MNPVKELENHRQAVWLDFLARGFVAKTSATDPARLRELLEQARVPRSDQ